VKELTCKELILDYLADYLDKALCPDVVADFERHLADCPPCMAYLNTYKKTRDLTRQAIPQAMPEELKAHLRQFLVKHLASG
jgi:anti-sigma factor (TIGR02949 family)